MNLLELLGPSPLVVDYGEWEYTRMTFGEVYDWQTSPGDVFEGVVSLPPGWFLHLVRASSGFPVVVFATATSGPFLFPAPSGEELELLISDVEYPHAGMSYGPLHAELSWVAAPPQFWTDFVGCEEVN